MALFVLITEAFPKAPTSLRFLPRADYPFLAGTNQIVVKKGVRFV